MYEVWSKNKNVKNLLDKVKFPEIFMWKNWSRTVKTNCKNLNVKCGNEEHKTVDCWSEFIKVRKVIFEDTCFRTFK